MWVACSRSEGSARPIGRILIDISKTCVRGIDIARSIDCHASYISQRSDRRPGPIRCELIDNATVIVCLKKITRAIKSYPPRAIEVSREGVLRAVRRDSHD